MAKKKIFPVKAGIEVKLTEEDIDDIMTSALEGGITYWASQAEVVGKYLKEYGSEQIARGGSLIIYDNESDDKWELTRDKFLNGVKLLLQNGDDKYGAFKNPEEVDCCEIDGEVADWIIQYALFGEVVFG